ncbi:preprotein translocase subunit SecE [Brachybacterium sp. EF45031]|uniref:preprotein translocase subunit SecE n=1 Tax=Brachybacterium sillae TaxID=2810536 RepID=UPI00217E209D|nr:preprotein translocase subunit SecE [Brachybacterium sillae]MCS6711262.1 preprotein translocase subunit SecE [Brachybacterium sillae]
MSSQPSVPTSSEEDRDRPGSSRNPFVAIGLFIRQVIAELRKVHVPTGGELVAFTITVLAFVAFMIVLIFALDLAFGWLSELTFSDAQRAG